MSERRRHKRRDGRPYRRAREQMFAIYGDICHLCGHAGATEADHIIPVSLDPDQPDDPYAMRPAHGGNGKCRTCGRACNAERGNGPVVRTLRTSQDW
jgi:hypothetical protein